jgi:isoquinoline 1-oxidoreductase beta subunit
MSPRNESPGELSADEPYGTSRRQFVGYVLAGSTLAVTAGVAWDPSPAAAAQGAEGALPIPSNAVPADFYDFMDAVRDAAIPTNHLLSLEVRPDGTAFFSLPRSDNGQMITTSFAQVIAEEMDIPFEHVKVELSPARPELMYNQLTGGSCSMYSLIEPVRAMALTARQKLMEAGAARLGVSVSKLRTKPGFVMGPEGDMIGYGDLAELASTLRTPYRPALGPIRGTVMGKPYGNVDARDIATGQKQFVMDLDIPNALPTMVCRAPTFHGAVAAVKNLDTVKKMPGVTDVGVISSGVAVRARTFGHCIDAIRALRVDWTAGSMNGVNSDSLLTEIAAAALPMAPADPTATVLEEAYTFQFRSGSPLETNSAVADVRKDSAEIWAPSKMPIIALQKIAAMLDLPEDAVTFHVIRGGGSFGRKLFPDAAMEAAEASQLFGKPVRLMWHRTDDNRHGRMHPGAVTQMRATVTGNSVTSFTMRHTSGATDLTHGLGEIMSGSLIASPDHELGNLGTAVGFFQIVTQVPYNFGPTDLKLNETFKYDDLPSSAVRNVYSPDTAVARELMVEKLAKHFNMDGYEFRRAFAKDEKSLAVLDKVADVGKWGRTMPAGTGQAIALHEEYKCKVACLMEIDARPAMVNRKIREAYTGPRVTKAIVAIDAGRPINPNGIRAMLMGGCMDGIAYAMSAGVHIQDGLPLEGSWDNYRYTRQWNAPLVTEFIVMPANRELVGGAGEVGIAVAAAAAAIAHQNATGKDALEFPLNFREPLGYVVKSRVPPIPQSPVNGRRFTR